MNQSYLIFFICVVIAIIALWREVQRENKNRLGWRVAAVLIAIIAFACLIVPISYPGSVSMSEKNQVLLLTEGYNGGHINQYLGNRVYTTDNAIKKRYPTAILISDPADILQANPTLSKIQVFGYGLNKEQLAQLKPVPLEFHQSNISIGISAVSWNGRLKTGEQLKVQGNLLNTTGGTVKIVLKGLGTMLDSAYLSGGGQFSLSTTPRNNGRAVYRLLLVNKQDTIENESIPLELEPVKPLNVLILASSPDFENKFIKNWLSENNFGVAMRNMISKDKFSQDFDNVPQQSLQRITPALLDKFDIVVSDIDVLKKMNDAESSALKDQVQQKGMGIIVRADTTLHSSFWLQRDFPVTRTSSQGQVITAVHIEDQKNNTSGLMIDPVYIGYQPYTQPLVTDQQGRILVSSSLAGRGKVIFTTLADTHNWSLGGDQADYALLWSQLISKAAKPLTATGQWTVATAVPQVNNHITLQLQTPAELPQIKVNQNIMPPVRRANLPFLWNTDFWPAHAGWQQVQLGLSAPEWWFAYPTQDWQILDHLKKLEETRAYAATFGSKSTVTKQIHQKIQIPVLKIYFYLMLLAACSWLWVEAKFLS